MCGAPTFHLRGKAGEEGMGSIVSRPQASSSSSSSSSSSEIRVIHALTEVTAGNLTSYPTKSAQYSMRPKKSGEAPKQSSTFRRLHEVMTPLAR